MRFLVTFKAETALLPDLVEADDMQVLVREDAVLFRRTQTMITGPGQYQLPLRFIESIEPIPDLAAQPETGFEVRPVEAGWVHANVLTPGPGQP